ncbi:MAG: 2Fe-2S iron-sulfur cluster-binding protein [Firmicutes bacterium]|nr:2Fe-2S iron-sulfur cluster-binding protein [Bacillota bacterium]
MAATPTGRMVEATIDGRPVAVPEGSTIREACAALGIEVPTLCFLENLAPVNVCRVCVVEVEGSRTLVPSCSRVLEPGMVVRTDTPRVRHSRRMVLELLASAVDLSAAGEAVAGWMAAYGADPRRYGPAGPAWQPAPAGQAPATDPGARAVLRQPVKEDNPLYVRDYSRCILCYKCVEACGEEAQHTFAIAVGGRGFDAHVTTEFDVPLPESACVYCGNCVGVCPTGALMPLREAVLRREGRWDPARQTVTATICPYCGVGCTLELHVQDNRIIKVTSPLESPVTHGHLCVKGRYGFAFVEGPQADPAS